MRTLCQLCVIALFLVLLLGSYPVTEHSGTTVPAASASIGNVEKQRHRRKKTAGASVLDNTGDDVSVTLSSDELADTVTSDDMDAYESSTEHQSDQFQVSTYSESFVLQLLL